MLLLGLGWQGLAGVRASRRNQGLAAELSIIQENALDSSRKAPVHFLRVVP